MLFLYSMRRKSSKFKTGNKTILKISLIVMEYFIAQGFMNRKMCIPAIQCTFAICSSECSCNSDNKTPYCAELFWENRTKEKKLALNFDYHCKQLSCTMKGRRKEWKNSINALQWEFEPKFLLSRFVVISVIGPYQKKKIKFHPYHRFLLFWLKQKTTYTRWQFAFSTEVSNYFSIVWFSCEINSDKS